eukprot:scaffold291227_cov18-Tisochrysis_lutea.AAC.1
MHADTVMQGALGTGQVLQLSKGLVHLRPALQLNWQADKTTRPRVQCITHLVRHEEVGMVTLLIAGSLEKLGEARQAHVVAIKEAVQGMVHIAHVVLHTASLTLGVKCHTAQALTGRGLVHRGQLNLDLEAMVNKSVVNKPRTQHILSTPAGPMRQLLCTAPAGVQWREQTRQQSFTSHIQSSRTRPGPIQSSRTHPSGHTQSSMQAGITIMQRHNSALANAEVEAVGVGSTHRLAHDASTRTHAPGGGAGGLSWESGLLTTLTNTTQASIGEKPQCQHPLAHRIRWIEHQASDAAGLLRCPGHAYGAGGA